MEKGKAYANRKSMEDRPKGDFYPTPKSLVWVAKELFLEELDGDKIVFDPCCGNGAISRALMDWGLSIKENDLFMGGVDYLETSFEYPQIVSNPPFSLWDQFVTKAKQEAEKVIFIGRMNYFGTYSRLKNGLWENLKGVYCFDRYVDYRTPERDDGLFHVGAMATAWFVWERGYNQKATIDFLSVQDYARLGNKRVDE